MNCEVNIDNKKKMLKLYYGLLVTVLCIIGVSFAWFRLYLSQTENNTLASRTCFDVSLTEDTSKIEITDAFPISDSNGLNEDPFTFTLKNNCGSYTKAYITIDSTYRTSNDSSYLIDDYIKVNLSSKDTTDGTSFILSNLSLTALENNRKGYIVKTTYLKPNEEKSYDLRVWMDSETTLNQGLNKKWAGKIVVLSEASKEAAPEGWYSAGDDTLLAAIRKDNVVTDTLTVPGAQKSDKKIYNQIDFDSLESRTVDMTKIQNMSITYAPSYEINDFGYFNLAGDSVVTDTYSNAYTKLSGKYFYPDMDNSTTSTSTNLPEIYYVVEATASSMTMKQITYKMLTYESTPEAVFSSTEDDYGTSYYFRGQVKNNYVEFANKCWRVVRITGEGSIKLVLHNDNPLNNENPCSSANNAKDAAFTHSFGCHSDTPNVSTEYFNWANKDDSYVGFMRGYGAFQFTGNYTNKIERIKPTLLSDKEVIIDYNEWKLAPYTYTHANTSESNILLSLYNWYNSYLTDYEDYLADIIWCNDKSMVTYKSSYNEEHVYGAASRLSYESYNSKEIKIPKPSLICPNDNDDGKLSKFTVNDKINGNGDLNYKIGLLTADELAYAGSTTFGENNTTYYLFENAEDNPWWTISPYSYSIKAYVVSTANGNLSKTDVTNSLYVRPSIALSSKTKVLSGNGTSKNPYVITKLIKKPHISTEC